MLSDNSPSPTPSPTYASNGNSTRTGAPYTPYVEKCKPSSNNNSSSNKSSSSNSSSITTNRNAQAAKYEAEKAKTTAVENIQKSLNTIKQADFNDEELKIDGDFGPKTQFAWNKLIESKGGAMLGAAIGSAVPVVGTVIGGIVGGIIGGVIGSNIGSSLGENVTGVDKALNTLVDIIQK